MKKFFLLSLVATLLYAPLSFAQEMPVVAKNIPQREATADDLYCREQSRGEDIVVDIVPSLLNSVPNTPLTFSGTIQNASDHLLTGASVFAKVFRRDGQNSDGVLVDQFLVKDALTIPANGSAPVQFDWMVPAYAQTGAYFVSTLVTVDNHVNKRSERSTADIMIEGGLSTASGFDATTLIVNGKNYTSGTAVQLGATEDAVLTATVVNSDKKAKEVVVVTEVFRNQSLSRQNLVHTDAKVYTIPGGGKLVVKSTVPASNLPTSEVVMSAQVDGTRSLLPVTITRPTDSYVDVRTLSLDTFPLMSGSEAKLMTCFHAQGAGESAALSLKLRVEDRNGGLISEETTPVATTPQLQGVSKTFESIKNYGYARLVAQITAPTGVVLDTYVAEYDCSKFEGMKCPQEGVVNTEPVSSGNGKSMGAYALGVFALIMALVAVALGMQGTRITKSTTSSSGGNNTNVLSVLALLIAASALFGVSGHSVEAKTTVWNSPSYGLAIKDGIPLCVIYSLGDPDQGCVLSPRYASLSPGASLATPVGLGGSPQAYYFHWANVDELDPAVTTVTYQVDVVNNTTGIPIADGATIPVGTVLRFIPKPFNGQDIRTTANSSWGMGGGTAYGEWGITGSAGVNAGNFLYSYLPSINYFFYLSTQIAEPTVSITHGGTATLSCNGTGLICTVTSGGSITSTVRFAATQGELYSALSIQSSPIRQYPNNTFTRVLYPVQDPALLSTAGCGNSASLSDAQARSCASQANANKLVLTVPQQTVGFNFNVLAAANNVPTPPVITGPATGAVSVILSFSVTATDADNDQIRYGVDWDNNGSVDQWIPGSGFVNSATSQTVTRSWPSAGTYTFQVLAQDTKNGNSTWTPKVVTISAAPLVSGEIFANGIGGAATILAGQQVTLSWNSNGVSACTASGVSTGESWTGTSNPGVSTVALFPSFSLPFYSYVLTCDGVALDSVMVFVNSTQCSDTIDNDADGLRDTLDPGCHSDGNPSNAASYVSSDNDETNGSGFMSTASLSATPQACGGIDVTINNMTSGPQWYVELHDNGGPTIIYQPGTTGSFSYSHTGLVSGSSHSYTAIITDNWGASKALGPVPATAPAACGGTDLTSEGLTVPGTGTVGSPLNFSATVRNSGTTVIGAFNDRFSYQWGGTGGAWTDLSNIPHAGLNAGLPAGDADSYTPLVTGNLYIQHCVDSLWQINEGANEWPNCTNNGGSPIVVGAPPVVSCTGLPGNASYYGGDDPGIAGNSSATHNAANTASKCEFICNTGFAWSGGICVAPQITQFEMCDLNTNNSCLTDKTVLPGTPVTVRWNSNTDSCAGSGPGFLAGGSPSGSDTVTASAVPEDLVTFDIICLLGSTPVSPAEITLRSSAVNPELTVSSVMVKINDPITLSWNTNNPLSGGEGVCTLSGGGQSIVVNLADGLTTGSIPNVIIKGRTTFRLTCPTGSTLKTVDILPENSET